MTIYFDHNATTPLDSGVLEEMQPFLKGCYANPSSIHSQGRIARAAIEKAREQVAELVNAHPSQVIFTSGGTEANNLALKGVMRGMALNSIITSSIEHPSIRDVARSMVENFSHTTLLVDENGYVLDDKIEEALNGNCSQLYSIMLANNETGVIQDISFLADKVRAAGQLIHTDAVQAVGKIVVDFADLNVNLMTLSAHKIYGPKGIGALIYDKAIYIEPILQGGGQEKGLRSGTENVAAIVGFGKAAELAKQQLSYRAEHVYDLRRYFEEQIKQITGIIIFAENANRIPNTTFFSLPGIDGETLLMQLDINGIAVTSGSACASKSAQPSHVLVAMGIDDLIARSAIRVSFGIQNTRAEVDEMIKLLEYNARLIASLQVVNTKI